MLSKKVQDALNAQINMEFHSSYIYLGMSSYCELNNFPGCAQWLRVQSEEEHGHAMRLRSFLLDRDCQVKLLPIAEATTEYDSVPEVFETALKQEQQVSQSINALYDLAHQEKSFAALVELQWFITEQVEEEKTSRDIVAKFRMIKDDPSAMIDMDRELGSRGSAGDGQEEG